MMLGNLITHRIKATSRNGHMRLQPKSRIAALAVVTAVMLAACGGGGATSPTMPSLTDTSVPGEQTTTTVEVDPEEAMLEYTACMREHGVDMPDPSSSEGGGFIIESDETSFETVEEAEKECSPILGAAFGDFELTPEEEAEMRDRELAFAQCMRDEGIDWPDPGPDGVSVIEFGTDDDVDPDTMNAAMETCSEDMFGESIGGFGISSGGIDSGSQETTP